MLSVQLGYTVLTYITILLKISSTCLDYIQIEISLYFLRIGDDIDLNYDSCSLTKWSSQIFLKHNLLDILIGKIKLY